MLEPIYFFRVVRNVKENKDYAVLPAYKKTIFTYKLSNKQSDKVIRDILKNRDQYKTLQLFGDLSRINPFALFAFSKDDVTSRFFISERKLEKLLEVFNKPNIREFTGPQMPRRWETTSDGSTTTAYPVFNRTKVLED